MLIMLIVLFLFIATGILLSRYEEHRQIQARRARLRKRARGGRRYYHS